ncbi:homoserine O-acetyltransferase MetX [Sporomusa termitida]|uniref:Homoserine O-acetyltransferase n=1 Tax=Sporomusa termitida TaxID=2377 RepID=A0A517DQ53_9FIRM|nr:homoserine O-acetyltransferase [Sporomusa termitida]QDR79406.1 Homoserine O-acetyltransferase [Sporomusa termitida]
MVVTFFPGFRWRSQLKLAQIASPEDPFTLEQGGCLTEITVAYETYGTLSAAGDNVILVAHALTGDSHPAAHGPYDEQGWWEPLIGPGRTLDTDRFYVICANVLGGCQGTTGPASPDPATGRAYGMGFPEITVKDMVKVQKRLLEVLRIQHLALVIGGSMGGMQALEWAVSYPGFIDAVVVIAAPGYAAPQAIAYNRVGRQAVMLDPAWQNGNYYGGPGPEKGLAAARALGMITYQSELSMAYKFGRRTRSGQFEVENYLDYQGANIVKRFDANSYLYLLRALDLFDISAGYATYEDALARIDARMLIVGVSSDILYPPHQQEELAATLRRVGIRAELAVINSPHGHDGFLIDFQLLRPILTRFIDAALPAPVTVPIRQWFRFRASSLAYLGARLMPAVELREV